MDNFDYDLVENYFLRNLTDDDFWLFGSNSGDDITKSINSHERELSFLGRTIFGSRITPSDIQFMIPVRYWTQGTIYTAYDNAAVMKDTPFYVAVEPEVDGGDFHLFKCISNNRNSPSQNKPEFTGLIANGIYSFPDGYIWKYMSSTPSTLFRRFSARGLMPVVRNSAVEAIASTGIYSLSIENPETNNGYEIISGIVESFDTVSSTVILNSIVRLSSSDVNSFVGVPQTFDFSTPGFYNGRSLLVIKNQSSPYIGAESFRIIESGLNGPKQFIRVTPTTFIQPGDRIQILPTIQITGDGTGALAVPIFENRKIVSTRMLSFGGGYTRAVASVIDPVQAFDTTQSAIRAVARPIISPENGHGSNAIRELKCRAVGIAKSISSLNNSLIPSIGKYSKVGLVKNPQFVDPPYELNTFDNRIKLISSEGLASVAVGETVRQGNVRGIVHQLDESQNAIFVADYVGPYAETFDDSLPIDTASGGLSINTIEYSPYISDTGDVLFISDLTSIERTTDKVEQIRLIVDF
jgi:hypothetical protein